jgi:hypothetical protein
MTAAIARLAAVGWQIEAPPRSASRLFGAPGALAESADVADGGLQANVG